jgi:anti-sigma regulatory factor (Ser/Thr protein kinase)
VRRLRRLAVVLGDALTADDAVRAALKDASGLGGVIRAGIALSEGAGRRFKFVSSEPDMLSPSTMQWSSLDAFTETPVVDAIRGGREIYIESAAELAEEYPDVATELTAIGTRSLAAVPLEAGQEIVGGLVVLFATEQVFSPERKWFLSAFAAQVTQAVRRGIAFQIQHATSEQLQRSLMPHSLPELEQLSLGAHYRTGGFGVDVGGDWYDVLPLPDGSVAVSLGDVMGKGVPAAIVMGEVRSGLRAYAVLDPAPSVVLPRLEGLVCAMGLSEQIVTLVYGVISADRRTLTYAVAGHPPPMLVPPDGLPTVLEHTAGPALGIGARGWPEHQIPMEEDTTLLLYSDGLVEARNLDLFDGITELGDHIGQLPRRRRHPRELCSRLTDAMWREGIDDDVTVLAAAVTAARVTRSARLELPPDLSAPQRARRFLRSRLTEWALCDGIAESAELCVSELVTNAVIHSGTGPQVTLRLDDDYLTVLVADAGGHGTVKRTQNYDATGVSGRGLTLVEAIASDWSAEHSADGTTVWFELELAADHAAAGAPR